MASRSSSADDLSINKILDELPEVNNSRQSVNARQRTSAKPAPRSSLSRSSSWSSVISSSSSSLSSSVAYPSSSSSDEEGQQQEDEPTTRRPEALASQDCRIGSLPGSPLGSLSSILDSPKYLSQSCPKPVVTDLEEDPRPRPSNSREKGEVKEEGLRDGKADDEIGESGSSNPSTSDTESVSSEIKPNRAERTDHPSGGITQGQDQCPPTGRSSKNNSKEMRSLKVDLLELSPRPNEQSSPSPLFGRRSPVGALGWRPVMPGYQQPKVDGQKLAFAEGEDGMATDRAISRTPDMSLKDYIPVMSKPLAVVCLVLNVLSPGLGTLLAGVSVLFCSTPRPVGIDRAQCLWVNTWVSVLQLLTTFLILLGWIWSIMWGVAFLSTSSRVGDEKDHHHQQQQQRQQRQQQQRGEAMEATSPRLATAADNRHDVTLTSGALSVRTPPPGPLSVRGHYQPEQGPVPMIILHENPLTLTASARLDTSGVRINPRHQRVIRRQEHDLLPSYLLDGQALENIVIRNAPVPDQIVFGRPEASAPESARDPDDVGQKGYASGDLESYGEQLGAAGGQVGAAGGQVPSTSRSSGRATGTRSRSGSRQRLL